jgi:ASPIC and UnbV
VPFGLGKTDRVETLKVTWPDGSEQKAEQVKVDQVLVLEQGQ